MDAGSGWRMEMSFQSSDPSIHLIIADLYETINIKRQCRLPSSVCVTVAAVLNGMCIKPGAKSMLMHFRFISSWPPPYGIPMSRVSFEAVCLSLWYWCAAGNLCDMESIWLKFNSLVFPNIYHKKVKFYRPSGKDEDVLCENSASWNSKGDDSFTMIDHLGQYFVPWPWQSWVLV